MEIEKTLTVAAPLAHVWRLLLDPKIMAGCVPGTQSVEVLSDVEYLAEIKVKISFIAARFKVKTTIVETRAPHYLRIEGTGEDSAVASSMKQTSELFLTDVGGGNTELRIKAKADVLGRLGSFGLSVMKTKADRMWDDFGANFAAVATRDADVANGLPATHAGAASPQTTSTAATAPMPAMPPLQPSGVGETATATRPHKGRWWQRIAGAVGGDDMPGERRLPTDICVEFHRADGIVRVLWPASAAPDAAKWLKDVR